MNKISPAIRLMFVSALATYSLAFSCPARAMDCAAATQPVERIVCASAELTQLDDQLNDRFRVAVLIAKDSPAFRAGQRAWLGQRNKCADEACLRRVYSQRVAELTKLSPIPEVWSQVMPGRFNDGWVFYVGPDAPQGFIPGEPVWLINSRELHTLGPIGKSPQWWDIEYTPRQHTPYKVVPGKSIEVFGFYTARVTRGVIDSGTSDRVKLRLPDSVLSLVAVPSASKVMLEVKRAEERITTDEYSSNFHLDCRDFWHLLVIKRVGRTSPPPHWYGVRYADGPLLRAKECQIDGVPLAFDSMFGVSAGYAWGDGTGPVLSDGSFMLVSGWWDFVHVLRVNADGTVPPSQSTRLKAVDSAALLIARQQALQICRARESAHEKADSPDPFNMPLCLIRETEQRF